jgi:hypothetical protein
MKCKAAWQEARRFAWSLARSRRAPEFAVALEPLGEAFVALITMMIQPVIFCTIVLGVGSVRSAAQVGKVGGRASAGTPGYSGRLPPAPPMVYGVV